MSTLAPQPVPTPHLSGTLLPRRDPITKLPIVTLFAHSHCNCKCLMCDIWQSTSRDEMSLGAVTQWLDEWRVLGVQRVVLSGGEALLNTQLWEICALLKTANIGITLLSTGLLLKRHAKNIVAYCDDVVVSLDGPNPVHNHIRNLPNAYAKLAEGVTTLLQLRCTPASLAISARCTVQKQNYAHLREIVCAAKNIGLDRISFLAADVSSEAFNRPEGWDAPRTSQVALDKNDLALLNAELDALTREHTADFASGFIAESPEKLRQKLSQYFSALLGKNEFAPVRCNAPWVSTVIETDGTVRPCFFQPALGTLQQNNLRGILNSPNAVAWRQGLDTTRNAICKKCVCSLALQ